MGDLHLIVDGSNIATEGRSLPSLQQLLDAVAAVEKESAYGDVTVIVDATFGHRIDESEKSEYDVLVNSGKIITPPAGVIGRGDAFILEVADRANAVVLSNDSFQEFHGTFLWLFDEGRLLGGKHVPGVGWIFLARNPVRGPTSRRAVSEAKRKRRGTKAPAVAKKKQTSKSSSTRKSAKKKAPAAAKSSADSGRKRGGKEPEPYNEPLPFIEFVGAHPVGSVVEAEIEQFASHGAYVVVDGTRCYVSLKSIADPAPRSARDVFELGQAVEFVVQAIDTPRRGIDLAVPGMETIDPENLPDGGDAGTPRGTSRGTAERTDDGAEDAPSSGRSSPSSRRAAAAKSEKKPASKPQEPTPEASAPAADVGDEKLSVSERRRRRAAAERAAKEAEEAAAEQSAKKAAADKRAAKKKPAKKVAAKKAPAKRAPAKKTTAKKRAAATKKTAAKSSAKKAPAKKTATASKQASAKKAPAKRTSAKKAPAKKTTAAAKKAAAKKTPAKKTPAKKAPAKTAAAKKAPAKRTTAKKTTAASKKAPAKKAAAKKTPAKKAPGGSSKT